MCCIQKRDNFATSCQFSIRIWSNNLNKNYIILHDPCTFHSIHHIFLVQVTTLTKAGVRACKILTINFGVWYLLSCWSCGGSWTFVCTSHAAFLHQHSAKVKIKYREWKTDRCKLQHICIFLKIVFISHSNEQPR